MLRCTLRRACLLAIVALSACPIKVPITDVNAGFVIADAAWFQEEQTLFVFYRVNAEQGIGAETQLELAFRTDEVEQDFAPLLSYPPVHTHVAVDCGSTSRCGSFSTQVVLPPRDVRIRMRYHRDGALTLDAVVAFNSIAAGPAHKNRSLVVYGVFDASNTRVQWRARHQFPTLRNVEVQALGLRRRFVISDAAFGGLNATDDDNPYGYGFAARCPTDLTPLSWAEVETLERARFAPDALPLSASTAPVVCAHATVEDASGTFQSAAVARKNPETASAFPLLRSPVKSNTVIRYFLRICDIAISEPHEAMQVQRLQLDGEEQMCVDDFAAPGFANQLASQFRARIDEVRAAGDDMVLAFALHHDDRSGRLASVVEDALEQILPTESIKSSPRVSGAFVFDSFAHALARPDLVRLVLWCPGDAAGDDLDDIAGALERSCALQPDIPDITLGPLSFNSVPILPTRAQYLTFIDKYSEAQAGRVSSMEFLAPERTPTSRDVPVSDFGVATFFNDEVLTAAPTDSFSYCAPVDGPAAPAVFRASAADDPAPLSQLPEAHAQEPQGEYGLGLLWDFPYLLRLKYEVVFAGAVDAVFVTVPFGIHNELEEYLGTALWQAAEFPLRDELLRCSRFCGHPTFDSAGVYNVSQPFNEAYLSACYRPAFPAPPGDGFPRDP